MVKSIYNMEVGDVVTLTDKWANHELYGRQLIVETIHPGTNSWFAEGNDRRNNINDAWRIVDRGGPW